MNFKIIVTKSDGGKISSAFNLLRDAKKYARKVTDPGDRVIITESGNKEVFTLYEYIVEDWRTK
jgi:hypothetical protein